jgi:hypothetical protein
MREAELDLFDRTREFAHDPVFCAELDDGRMIRMSCFCANGLDWQRGDRLIAWVLAEGDRFRGCEPVPIKTWFEHRGQRIERPEPAPKRKAIEGAPEPASPAGPEAPAIAGVAASEAPDSPGVEPGGEGDSHG